MPSPTRGEPGREDDANRILPDLDPVPPEAVADARAAFDPGSRHELATLVYDSLLDGGALPYGRVLHFEHARRSVELRINTDAPQTVIEGSIEPAGPSTAVLHVKGAERSIVAPVEDRTFRFTSVGHGPVRISLEGDGEPDGIWTDWFRI